MFLASGLYLVLSPREQDAFPAKRPLRTTYRATQSSVGRARQCLASAIAECDREEFDLGWASSEFLEPTVVHTALRTRLVRLRALVQEHAERNEVPETTRDMLRAAVIDREAALDRAELRMLESYL